MKLYEKSPVKRDFLRDVKNNLNIKNISIENNVYEKEVLADVIVCRAFKKLEATIQVSREIAIKSHKLIILKGQNAQEDLKKAFNNGKYDYKLERSITNAESKIIIVDFKKWRQLFRWLIKRAE